MSRVALLGLGRMGAAMAARLAAAGHELTVWNRTPRPERVPEGAVAAASPGEAVRDAEVIVTMLADAAALDAVLEDVLDGAARGAVLVDMGTIGPAAARAAGALAEARGLAFVDAPVSGSVVVAEAGDLVAMAGGADAAIDRARPALSSFCREVVAVGPIGAGAALKLAINLALAVTNETIAETLLLAQRSGVSREKAYDVLALGALASPFVRYKREAFLAPEEAPVAFSVELMRKDVGLALQLAADAGLSAPAGRAAGEVLERAIAHGLGEADIVNVLRELDRR